MAKEAADGRLSPTPLGLQARPAEMLASGCASLGLLEKRDGDNRDDLFDSIAAHPDLGGIHGLARRGRVP